MPRQRVRRKFQRRQFTIDEILQWADAHYARKGVWPQIYSGPISECLSEKWRSVDNALRLGLRGIEGGSSLARLLAEKRNVRNVGGLPALKIKQVLAWADSHHKRTGAWPTSESGPIPDAPGETWRAVDGGLRIGVRGLKAGSSLAKLLAKRRGQRNLQELPPFTVRQILAWADAHHKRNGKWPTIASGPITDAPGETWSAVGVALSNGRRSLPGRSTLAQLLAARRGVYNARQLAPFTLPKLRAWARAYKKTAGHWPTSASGPVDGVPGTTWKHVCDSLRDGYRGLPGGQTLAVLWGDAEANGIAPDQLPHLTDDQILAWADALQKRTGRWPHARSGPIPEAPDESWRTVDRAFHTGQRGLTRMNSLVQFLAERRNWRVSPYAPHLRCEQILKWIDAFRRRVGTWPNQNSGPILEAPGENWRAVDEALRLGSRGLRVRTCLARFIAEKRGVRNRTNLPRLTYDRIWSWAKKHYRRTGRWPTGESGPVVDAPGETWKGIDVALRHGCRGLPIGHSLSRLQRSRREITPRK